MRLPCDERLICEIRTKRKGRNQSPCKIGVTISATNLDERIVLRTEDVSGKAPIVAYINNDDALILGNALIEACKATK